MMKAASDVWRSPTGLSAVGALGKKSWAPGRGQGPSISTVGVATQGGAGGWARSEHPAATFPRPPASQLSQPSPLSTVLL